jgi:chromosome segregation ATPase
MMSAVNNAYAAGDIQGLYDLADEIDPADLAELAAVDRAEVRDLRMQLTRLQGRKRRAERRLGALHEENTARLRDKAKRLDADDTHWWEIVRKEIEAAISRIREETVDLNAQIKTLDFQPNPQPSDSITRDN